jgi:RHS repeat-associated protein
MGYGWNDNWASSLTADAPVPGDIYLMDGLRTDSDNDGPATSQPMMDQGQVVFRGGNVYIDDMQGDRILEVAGSSGTQWGISMAAGNMYTIVGSPLDVAGDSPNGTSASSALLYYPQGLAVDSAGNLYIADTGNNRILEVPAVAGQNRGFGTMTVGDIYTIAGSATGASGQSGDQSAATSALLDQPTGLAIGPNGSDLYIADTGNNRVQEVPGVTGTQWSGTRTAYDMYTIAGNASGFAGSTGDGNVATSADLNGPLGVSLSSAGDLYIADTQNNRIQEVPAASGAQWGITPSFSGDHMYTVAGTTGSSGHSPNGTAATSALLNLPDGITVGNGTQMYIADGGSNYVEEVARTSHTEWGISMTAGDLYTIAGNGDLTYNGGGVPATSSAVNDPTSVALDGSANLYIAGASHRVLEVSAATADISTFAGDGYTLWNTGNGGNATTAALHTPSGAATDALGDVFIADAKNNRIQEIAASNHTQFGVTMTAGDVYTVAGNGHGSPGSYGDGLAATSAFLTDPQGVAVDTAGDLFIADSGNNRVQEVPATTGGGMTAGDMYTVAGSSAGVQGSSGDGGAATSALLNDPASVAVDSDGDLYIADEVNNRVQEVPATTGGGMTAGDMYTVAGSSSGTAGSSGDGGAATSALLNDPVGIATDSVGDLYIADSANNRIQEVYTSGGSSWGQSMTAGGIYTITGQGSSGSGTAGDGGPAASADLNGPDGIAVDSSGDLYIADAGNNRIQEIAATSGTQWSQQMTAGDTYTVVGQANGTGGLSGDGGPATSAYLWDSDFVAVDPSGNLYITDYEYNRLLEVVSATTSPFTVNPAPTGITVTQSDGSQVTFYPQSGGSCTAPYVAAGSYCTLPQNVGVTLSYSSGTATWTYSPDPGDTYTYNSAGQLTTDSDAAGDTLGIAYTTPAPGSGHCPPTAASCETITAANGRALVVGSNSSGLTTSVTDPMGREWTYAYTGSDLTSTTDPMGNVTSYTYGQGSTGNPLLANDLLRTVSPNAQPGGPDAGDAAVNVYDSFGRVISQTDPMGYQTSFNYCVNDASDNCMDTATGTGFVTVTDPDGNTTVDDYEQGTIAAQSMWTGGTTFASEQDDVPDVTAGGSSSGTLLDTVSADADGNITSSVFNSSGYATSITSPDGLGSQLSSVTRSITTLDGISCTANQSTSCSSDPGPPPVAPGGVVAPPSSAPPSGITYTLYDTDGNELYNTTGVYEPGASTAAYQQTSYQLFKGNSVTLGSINISCTASPPSMSLPCATISPDGVATQLSYDSAGDLTSSSSLDGNGTQLATTTSGYDADGEQTSSTQPEGNLPGANSGNYTTVMAYNADGENTSTTQAGGSSATVTPRSTSYGYDADGNQTTTDDARGYTTTTSYNADDDADLVTDPNGNATLTCYNGVGNIAQTVPASGVAENSLSPSSCPSSYPSGYQNRLAADATASTFDAAGHVTVMTTPAPAGQTGYETTSYTYDGNGNPLKTTGPPAAGSINQVTVDTYNSVGELASETDGYGTSAASTTTYCYDPDGDTTSVVVPDGNSSGAAACETSSPWVVSASSYPTQAAYQTTSSFDSTGELVSTTSPVTTAAPAGGTTAYTYDADGNRLTSTDPDGIITTWTYTPRDDVATESYSGSSAHSVSYTYDANDNLTSMTDGTGSSSYSYDSFAELTSATDGAGQTVGYGYDADGDVASVTYPLPSTASWATTDAISYGYTKSDIMNQVTDFNGHQIQITIGSDSLPTSTALGASGDTIATTYDPTDAPSQIALTNSSGTLQKFSYSDAPAGDILSETDTPASSGSPMTYTYDAQGRITSMTPGSGSAQSYSPDASGNLGTLPGGATGYYGHDSELTSSVLGGTTINYAYNADGQRLTATVASATVASATWNGDDRLTSYDNSAADMTAATYDGDGLRASATSTPAGGSSTTQNFVWNNSSQVLMDSANAYIYADGLTPVEQINLSSGTASYLVTDSLGSVRGIVNSTGALIATTSYDVWGNPQAAGGLTSYTPFGFAGGYTDPTGLIYLLNRYYDPATGQFISVDPDVSQTDQPYAYAGDDPVDNDDPNGAIWNWAHHTWGKKYCESRGGTQACVSSGYLLGAVFLTFGEVTGVAAAFSVNSRLTPESDNTLAYPSYRWVFRKAGKAILRVYSSRDSGTEGRDYNYWDWEPVSPFGQLSPSFTDGAYWFCLNGKKQRTYNNKFKMICNERKFAMGTPVDVELWAENKKTGVRFEEAEVSIDLESKNGSEGNN